MGTRIWNPGDGLGLFGTSVNNNGSVNDIGTRMELLAPAVAADAAIAYYNEVNPDRTKTWTHKIRPDISAISGGSPSGSLRHHLLTTAGPAPTTIAGASLVAISSFTFFFSIQSGTYELYISYIDTGGTGYWWNDGSSIWQTSFVKGTTSFTGALNTQYTYIIESDGTNAILTIKNAAESSTLWGPASVAWSGVQSNGTDWFTWGEILNDSRWGQMNVYGMEYEGPEIVAANRFKRSDIQGNSRFTRGGLINA